MIYRGKQKAWIGALVGFATPVAIHFLQRWTDIEVDVDRTAELIEAVIVGLVTGAGTGSFVYGKANKN